MARSDLVKALMWSHQQGDDRAFHSAAEAIIEDERRKRHGLLADDLVAILEDPTARRRPLQVSSLTPLPKARDEHPLLNIVQSSLSFHDLVLYPSISEVLESVVDEFRLRSQLRAHGVQPRSTLLFVGPPGCGKSASALAIAGELGLPVARIQLAVVVSSYLGETAKNLEQIFRFLETGSWVLLFDEFDLLGRERADRSDHGELRRVVAAMLQIIDEHHADSLFIATSNHPALLDTAVWRRFDDVVEFDLPDETIRASLIRLKLRGVRYQIDVTATAKAMDGYSPAEIESACLNAMRLMVRHNEQTITDEHMAYGMRRGEARRRSLGRPSTAAIKFADR